MNNGAEVRVNDAGDILWVRLEPDVRPVVSRSFGDLRNVDYDSEGRVVGVELIGRPGDLSLDGLPEADRVRDALLAHGYRIGGDPMFVPGANDRR